MRVRFLAPRVFFGIATVLLVLALPFRSQAADSAAKVEVQLIWGTNDSKSPDPKHKPVEAAVLKKIKELPLKWSHYFEVNRKVVTVGVNATKKEALSEKCSIEIRNPGRSKVEVFLFGKGEQVVKQSQDFPVGETLVVGGNAPNATAWLVFLKRLE